MLLLDCCLVWRLLFGVLLIVCLYLLCFAFDCALVLVICLVCGLFCYCGFGLLWLFGCSNLWLLLWFVGVLRRDYLNCFCFVIMFIVLLWLSWIAVVVFWLIVLLYIVCIDLCMCCCSSCLFVCVLFSLILWLFCLGFGLFIDWFAWLILIVVICLFVVYYVVLCVCLFGIVYEFWVCVVSLIWLIVDLSECL